MCGSNKLVVDNLAALALEFEERLHLLKSIRLSLFDLRDNLRLGSSGRGNELRGIVRLGLRDQEGLLNRSDDLVSRLGNGRSRYDHLGLVFNLFLHNFLAFLVLGLGGLLKSSILLFIIHILSAGFNSLKVGQLPESTNESLQGAQVSGHQNSKE